MNRVIFRGVVIVLALVVQRSAHGQRQANFEVLAQRWTQAVADAAAELTGAADRRDQRRREALASLSQTERFFASHGDRGQAWRNYLQLDRCRQIVSSSPIVRKDLAQLRALYAGSHPGLELSAVMDLPDLRGLTGHGEISVRADLNLNPLVESH